MAASDQSASLSRPEAVASKPPEAAAAADSQPLHSNSSAVKMEPSGRDLPEEHDSTKAYAKVLYKAERLVLETDELALRQLQEEPALPAAAAHALASAVALASGEYEAVLTACPAFSEPASRPFRTLGDLQAEIVTRIQSYLGQQPGQHQTADDEMLGWRSAELVWVAAAALNLFLQANYTGPELSDPTIERLEAWFSRALGVETPTAAANTFLSVDGELPYPRSTLPVALLLARIMLSAIAEPDQPLWSAAAAGGDGSDAASAGTMVAAQQQRQQQQLSMAMWWNARATVAHARLLLAPERCRTLWDAAQRGFGDVIGKFGGVGGGDGGAAAQLAARAWQEWGLAEHHFEDVSKGKEAFGRAQAASGLRATVSGALGKRTKYQQRELAQIVLLAESAVPAAEEPAHTPEEPGSSDGSALASANGGSEGGQAQSSFRGELGSAMTVGGQEHELAAIRTAVHDGDSHLLEAVQFSEDAAEAPSTLSAIDLCTVLALCLDVANSNPRDGLTNEQMSPYIDRVLRTPSNWMIYSTALLQRAWIEFERPHLAERSALQLQALLDQHTTRLTITQASVQSVEESAKVPERLAYIHSITYPPRWELKRDMAQRYAKLGVYGSAAEMFVELELWDEAVECYAAMQLEGAAEKIVRARLAEAETPQMRCALGDLTQDPQHYERAWRLSGGRLARAKTALGRYFFFKGDYETAVAHFQAAVAVKPLLPRAWFTLGAALMRLERWPEALAAFTRVVAQEPDDGEAWGNCGAIHLRAGEYERASAALAQALRQNRASWRMWDNQITALLHLERWDEAVYAMHRFLDLRDKHQQPPDTGALAILAQAAVAAQEAAQQQQRSSSSADAGGSASSSDAAGGGGGGGGSEDAGGSGGGSGGRSGSEATGGSSGGSAGGVGGSSGGVESGVDGSSGGAAAAADVPLVKAVAELLGRVAASIKSDAQAWEVYAVFNERLARGADKVADCRAKQCRALLARSGWERNPEAIAQVADASEKLSAAYRAQDTPAALYQAKMHLKSCCSKVQAGRDAVDCKGHLKLQALLAEVTAKPAA